MQNKKSIKKKLTNIVWNFTRISFSDYLLKKILLSFLSLGLQRKQQMRIINYVIQQVLIIFKTHHTEIIVKLDRTLFLVICNDFVHFI